MANGRVITGFSHPVYSLHSGSTRTANILARGVSASIEVESADSVDFYADNGLAETYGGGFTGGTLNLTVDGLLDAAEHDLFGRETTDEGWKFYNKDDVIPETSVGFIVRYMSGGVTSYVPVILSRCRFNLEGTSANTQAEGIEFQTQELSAKILIPENGNWKMVGAAETTEAAAITSLEEAIIVA